MANRQFDGRVQQKRDTDANWTTNNPVILKNELIFVDTDKGVKMKMGDGVTAYNNLDFLPIGSGSGFVAQSSSPSDTDMLWIDTGNGGILKYYNGSAWVATAAVWG